MSRSSIAAVGVWSIFASIVTFVSVADIGFSQLLTREAGLAQKVESKEVYKDYIAAKRAYYIILIAFSLFFLTFKQYLLLLIGNSYSGSLTVAVLVLLTGSIAQLIAKLDAAILSAWHENVTVQVSTAIAPVFMYIISLIGAWFRMPIEGMALGTLMSGITTVTILRLRINKVNPDWHKLQTKILWINSLERLPSLFSRGWYLYSSSIALLIRGPLYRFIIASLLGLQAVAAFDIAMRLTQMAREVIASGFSVLYPTFNYYYRTNDHTRIIDLIRFSLFILLGGGTFIIGVLVVGGEQLLKLWLGLVPLGALDSIRWLGLWQIITIINVPFWYLLQAAHLEKVASTSIWVHTILIIALIPASQIIRLDLNILLIYWISSSVLTQLLIYFHVHTRLNAFICVFNSLRMIVFLAINLLFIFLCYEVLTIDKLFFFCAASLIYVSIIYSLLLTPFNYYLELCKLKPS
ncbi:MAG: oligosaccharide flippase family protein [Geobacter sp.]|nr:oligosaccharide flippase family protein [Geobacter sp.]